MTAVELYEKETGNKRPSYQVALLDWHKEYVRWLEAFLLKYYDNNSKILSDGE